jgi:aspartyl-tRNA(Asn)/glutamyl-tRNA(Gln) amidotransferase subunit B
MPQIKTLANIITTNLLSISTKNNQPVESIISISDLIKLASYFEEDKVNNQGIAKSIELLVQNPNQTLDEILKQNGLLQTVDTSALSAFVDTVIENNPTQVEQYKSGKIQIIGFLVGKCMQESKGSGNPKIFNQLLVDKLK